MKILAIVVSCQLGSAGNGGRYRSACLSCRPGLRATWRHFCILCTTQTFAYCVFCMLYVSLCAQWWWRSGWEVIVGCCFFLIYISNQNIHILVALLYLYVVFVCHISLTLDWLLLAWAARSWNVKYYEEDDIFVMFCWIFSSFILFALRSLFCMFFVTQI